MKPGDLVRVTPGVGRIPLMREKNFGTVKNCVVTKVNCSSLCVVLTVKLSRKNKYDSRAQVLTEKGHVGWAYVHDFDMT